MRRVLFALLLSGIAAASLIAAVAVVGKFTRARLHDRQAQTIRIQEIDFNPPPDQDRDLFLAELQYECGLEDQINLLDDDLLRRLTQVFLQHPRVESLQRISIDSGKRLHISLTYRKPVLAIAVGDHLRAIDRLGILLPPDVGSEGLLVLRDTQLPPMVESGNVWADERMLAAARTARYLQPYQHELHLVAMSLREKGEIVLKTDAGTSVLWGHAPGEESKDEAQAVKKIEKLRQQGDLDHPAATKEIDLR
jgi:hypothetical protein